MDTPENNLTLPLDEENNLQDTPQPAVDYTEENIRHLDDMEQYQNKGVNALLLSDLIPVYQQLGFEYAESNVELELNGKVQAQWDYFKTEQHKRRRAFVKEIVPTT